MERSWKTLIRRLCRVTKSFSLIAGDVKRKLISEKRIAVVCEMFLKKLYSLLPHYRPCYFVLNKTIYHRIICRLVGCVFSPISLWCRRVRQAELGAAILTTWHFRPDLQEQAKFTWNFVSQSDNWIFIVWDFFFFFWCAMKCAMHFWRLCLSAVKCRQNTPACLKWMSRWINGRQNST